MISHTDPPADPSDNGVPIGPDQSIWDGQKIANAFHKQYNRFIATLRTLDVITRARWAIAYVEYMNARHTLRTPLTAEHITRVWNNAMRRDITLPRNAA